MNLTTNESEGFLLKGSLASFGLQAGSMILAFVASFVIARLFKAEKFGTYTFVFTLASIISGLAVCGFDNLLLREMGRLKAHGKLAFMKGLLFISSMSTFLAACVFSVIGYQLLLHLDTFITLLNIPIAPEQLPTSENRHLFLIGFIAIPLLALIRLSNASLLGLKHIVAGQFPESIVKPFLFIVTLLGLYFLLGNEASAYQLIQANVVIIGFVALFCIALLLYYIYPLLRSTSAEYQSSIWLKAAFPFFLISSVSLIKVKLDIVLLGSLTNYTDVGIYTIPAKLSELIRFILVMVNTVMAPLIVGLYAEKKIQELQHIVRKSAWFIFLVSLPIALAFIVGGKFLLSLYGEEYVAGYAILVLFSCAQIFNLATGFGASLLMMTGYEKQAFWAQFVTFIFELILHLILIPLYGMWGAAIAVAISVVFYNVLLVMLPVYYLGVNPSLIGSMRSKE